VQQHGVRAATAALAATARIATAVTKGLKVVILNESYVSGSGSQRPFDVATAMKAFYGGIAAIGVLGILVALMLPSVGSAPTGARTMSNNNLKQLGLGFQIHHDVQGTLPAGVLANQAGDWLHGWHTQLLPYIELSHVYDEIDLTKSWRDPANAHALKYNIPVFLNPRRHWRLGAAPEDVNGLAASHYASNVLVIGGTRRMKFSEITDGVSQTVLEGEAADNFRPWGDPIGWRDPRFGLNQTPNGFGGSDGQTTLLLLADGSVRQVTKDVSPRVLRALFTPAGGDQEDLRDLR
jgi:hypothetical protein